MNLLNLPPCRQEELLFAQGREVNEQGREGPRKFGPDEKSGSALRHVA